MAVNNERFKYFAIDQKDPIWKELHDFSRRPMIISASSVCNIIGHGYESCTRMWEYYTGIRHPDSDIDPFKQKLFDWGHDNEPNAIATFNKHWANFKGVQPGFLYDAKQDWLGASLDYICVPDYSYLDFNKPDILSNNNLLNLECKCPYNRTVPMNVEEVKAKHIIQCQIQMHVSGINNTCLLYWSPYNWSAWHITKDNAFYDAIEPILIKFMGHVTTKTKPPRGGFKKVSSPHVERIRKNLKPFNGILR